VVGEGLRLSNDFLLDTGIIIRYLRKNRQAADLLDYLEKIGGISVSSITYMEILIKCRLDEEQATLLFFDRVPPVTIGREIAHKAALLISKYPIVFGKVENPHGFPDALIAATAWQRGSTLVTLNTRDFTRVPIAELAIQAIDQNAHDWVATLKI
jgi:predicted nucleic acid-binding protein